MSSKCLCYRGVHGNKNTRVHFAATVASKFARFKSGWLLCVEHTAKEDVQHTISTTSNIASVSSSLQLCISGVAVFQFVSGRAVVISNTVFNSDIVFYAITASLKFSFTSWIEQLIFRSDFLAVVSYDVHFNTWESFNSQGKVVTLFRCSGHLLR